MIYRNTKLSILRLILYEYKCLPDFYSLEINRKTFYYDNNSFEMNDS